MADVRNMEYLDVDFTNTVADKGTDLPVSLYTLGMSGNPDLSEIINGLENFYCEIKHSTDYDELMEEAVSIYCSMKNEQIGCDAADAVKAIEKYGYDYSVLTVTEKARFIFLKIEDPNYSLKLHSEVLMQLGVKLDIDEQMDDYQRIYEKKVEEKDREKNIQIERSRGR